MSVSRFFSPWFLGLLKRRSFFFLGLQTLQCWPSTLLPSQVVDVSSSDLKQPGRLCEVPNVGWLSPVGCWWFSSCQDVSKTFCVPRKPPSIQAYQDIWTGMGWWPLLFIRSRAMINQVKLGKVPILHLPVAVSNHSLSPFTMTHLSAKPEQAGLDGNMAHHCIHG